jgi:hypothetical protein
MSTNGIAIRTDAPVTAPWRLFSEQAQHFICRKSTGDLLSACRTGMAVCTANMICCLSLWLSLAAAIWLARGWIGLFFSGQIVSAGAYLLKILFKRTCHAFSAN